MSRYYVATHAAYPHLYGVYDRRCGAMVLDGYYLDPAHAERVAIHLGRWITPCPRCQGVTLTIPKHRPDLYVDQAS